MPQLHVPDPQFPRTTPVGGPAGGPVALSTPDDQPDSTSTAGAASVGKPRTAPIGEHVRLPVRTPGAHLHPPTPAPAEAERAGEVGSR
jgi:hypothetical protein